jgi:hypothetical protein
MQMIALSRPTRSRLQRFMLTRPAPMSGNDLGDDAYTAGVMQSITAASPSAAAAVTPAADTGPGFFTKVGEGLWSFAQSDAAKNLASGALQLYSQKQDQKTAASQAASAAASTKAAQKLATLQAQTAAMLAQKKSGTPSWVMPVAIAGGVAVLGLIAFLVLRKKSA